MNQFNLTPSDQYVSLVQGPLTTEDSEPIHYEEKVEDVNKEVFDKLLRYYDKNQIAGYFQSHPFSQIFTNYGMAVDEATLNNNYMRLVFGGKPNALRDNIHAAYDYAIKQRADSAIVDTPTLNRLNPSDFVEGEQSTKDALLETFKSAREYHKGVVDTDTERALKQRPTHDIVHTTFYNKKLTKGGESTRYNKVVGQYGHLQFRPNTSTFYPFENLSSRTYAPDGHGGENPLKYQAEYGIDPRVVPATGEKRQIVSESKGVFNLNDLGSYPGREVDRYVTDYVDKNASLEQLFRTASQRRWV